MVKVLTFEKNKYNYLHRNKDMQLKSSNENEKKEGSIFPNFFQQPLSPQPLNPTS
jgi:hypothetical protein